MAKRRKSRKSPIPAVQGTPSEVGYCKPPAEHQFKPGQSGNPAGRPKNIGSSVLEWMNQLADIEDLDVLEKIVKDRTGHPMPKRHAARLLLAAGDIERSTAGAELDRVLDRTIGKPVQGVEVTGKDGGDIGIAHNFDPSKLSIDELRRYRELRLKASAGRTDN